MVKKIIEYKRYKDLINIKETEVWLSILLDLLLCFILNVIHFYYNFSFFIDTINGIFNSLIGGLIGIIGFSLSGMAIMVGLFNKKQIQLFIKLNGENKIEQIMSSYAFLAFISAMVVALLLGLSCLFSSEIEMISPIPFWIIVFLIIYLILFDLLYAVALVFNCILMFGIKQTYDVNQDEAFLPMANEIRIDYILRLLVQICDLKHADVMKHLENETSNLSKEERIKLKEYFAEHYPSDDKE